ncbi:MAG: SDR family oxidoreductase [Chloroflexota bacterium]
MTDNKCILVTGATGYIGGRLVSGLLEKGLDVRVMTRDLRHLGGRSWLNGVEVAEGDVLQPETLPIVLQDVDTAYYLIHSMESGSGFQERDQRAARNFAVAANKAGVRHIIYLGGLASGEDSLSTHLESRQEVGDILRQYHAAVTEFRAAAVIGSGSASFEIIRYLTERLPAMLCPQWVFTRTQPIAVQDVIAYLTAAYEVPQYAGNIVEIGGASVLAYIDMMRIYAELRGLRRYMIRVPVLTPNLSSYWVHLVTPVSFKLVKPLVEGLRNQNVVQENMAKELFPHIQVMDYRSAVERALADLDANRVESSWTDSMAAVWEEDEPYVFTEARGMMIERRKRTVEASSDKIFLAFTQLGGATGWLYLNWLWRVRSLLDRWLGGPGHRQGRRDFERLRVGDVIDFWRVEALELNRLLRLRAEMRLPGRGWLEFKIEPLPDGRNQLVQTAYFAPRGLFGYLYWYSIFFIHKLIFDGMIDQIVQRAEGERYPIPRSHRWAIAGMVSAIVSAVVAVVFWWRREGGTE